jgi:predicted NBD/HSP70 family sugar kinase
VIAEARDALIGPSFIAVEKRTTAADGEKQILGQLFRRGPCTQAELTDLLPYSQQSISRMITSLETRTLVVRGSPKQSGRRGQPSVTFELNSEFAYSLGVSLMAHGLSVCVTDFTGRMLDSEQIDLPSMGRKNVFDRLNALKSDLMNRTGVDVSETFGMGVAVSGFRVGPNATFNSPRSLEEFSLTDLEALFSSEFDLPVWAENDGKAATIAENMTGVGRKISNFAYMYVATGIGGGVIVDGNLLTGVNGNAGELSGILPIDLFETRPTLESLRLKLNASGVDLPSVHDLIASYDDGWPGISEWIEDVEPTLSLMVSATAAVLDTEAIVLGGLMPEPLALRLIPKIQFFDINRRSVPREHAKVLPAKCPENATALGASLLPFEDKFFAF